MKITGIKQSRHRLPLDPPFIPSWDTRPRHHFDLDLVRVETDEGISGFGAGDSMAGFAGHEELFIGQDPMDLDRHARVIENISFHYGRCWPLDIALWDLSGKILGQPVWRLLGGRSNKVQVYASSGSLRKPDELVELALSVRDAGMKAMKVRFHRPHWREDIAILEKLRTAVGQDLELMVDCNQGWRMPWDTAQPWALKEALTVARELERLGVYWMEEPLHRGDYQGMQRLRAQTDIRIAGAEMTRELHELRHLIETRCLDVLQPDAAVTGGLSGLSRIARMVVDSGLAFTPHTWGHGIGLMANAHLAAGVAGSAFLELPHDPPVWTAERRDFGLTFPIIPDQDGWIKLTETPGLGVELDEDLLAHTRLE